jgi:hypothetical protein
VQQSGVATFGEILGDILKASPSPIPGFRHGKRSDLGTKGTAVRTLRALANIADCLQSGFPAAEECRFHLAYPGIQSPVDSRLASLSPACTSGGGNTSRAGATATSASLGGPGRWRCPMASSCLMVVEEHGYAHVRQAPQMTASRPGWRAARWRRMGEKRNPALSGRGLEIPGYRREVGESGRWKDASSGAGLGRRG